MAITWTKNGERLIGPAQREQIERGQLTLDGLTHDQHGDMWLVQPGGARFHVGTLDERSPSTYGAPLVRNDPTPEPEPVLSVTDRERLMACEQRTAAIESSLVTLSAMVGELLKRPDVQPALAELAGRFALLELREQPEHASPAPVSPHAAPTEPGHG